MQLRTTPYVIVFVTGLVSALLTALTLHAALGQPWLGIDFADSGNVNGLKVVSVASGGPAAALAPGDIIMALSAGDNRLVVEPFDIAAEPDTAETYAAFNRFFDRQAVLASILRSGRVTISLADGRNITVAPQATRPLSDLPADFWILVIVSLLSLLVGAWALAFRRDVYGVRILALNGVALIICCMPAAIFMSRELALDPQLFWWVSSLNFVGASGVSAALFALFLVHPRRLVPPGALTALAVFYGVCLVLEYTQFGLLSPGWGRYFPITLFAVAAVGAAITQYILAKGEPQSRAAVGWFGLGLAMATVAYVIFYTVPILMGLSPSVPPWLSYASGLVVYAGMVLSIMRYRLFDLENWAIRVLFYVVGALVLAAIDIMLINFLTLDRLPAFGVALALVSLFYLPLRDLLTQKLLPRQPPGRLMFQDVVEVALATHSQARDRKWQDLLTESFYPLNIGQCPDVTTPQIVNEGVGLLVPGFGIVSSLRLDYAHDGRRLFSTRDLDLVAELCAALNHAAESRDAYARGMAEERARIARDMHDNIGAKLLSALHGTEMENKNHKIRDALADLRDIINNAFGSAQVLDDTLAELRLETAERLSDAGLVLNWSTKTSSGEMISPVSIHALRSIVREAISNAIRHAEAKTVMVELSHSDGQLNIQVSDDGLGTNEQITGNGTGLDGIRSRLSALKGRLEIDESGTGFLLRASFPSRRNAAL